MNKNKWNKLKKSKKKEISVTTNIGGDDFMPQKSLFNEGKL